MKIRRYEAEPTPELFHADDSFVRCLMGPIASGKSVAMCMEIVNRALRQNVWEGVRRSRWAIVRNTYRMLETTALKTWEGWIPNTLVPIQKGSPITAKVGTETDPVILDDGTRVELEVWFFPLDKPSDAVNIASLELTGMWINEAREMPWEIIEMMTRPVGRFPPKDEGGSAWSGVIMDTNPPSTRHWWYRLAEVVKPDRWRFFRQPAALIHKKDGTWKHNPLAENIRNLDGGYDYYVRQLYGKDPEWCRIFIEGLYGNTFSGEPVFKEIFDDRRHVATEPLTVLRGLPIRLSFDFGTTPACIICQVGTNGQLRILKECQATRAGIRQFVEGTIRPLLLNDYRGMPFAAVCDPAGNQANQVDLMSPIEELRRLGIDTKPASTNEFEKRRESVISCLLRNVEGNQPALILDPSCSILREGFLGGYQFARIQISGPESRYRDVPEKNSFSHLQDCTQYECLEVEGERIGGASVGKAWPERKGWAL